MFIDFSAHFFSYVLKVGVKHSNFLLVYFCGS